MAGPVRGSFGNGQQICGGAVYSAGCDIVGNASSTTRLIPELEGRIGYRFSDHTQINRALTHSSAMRAKRGSDHYERLEFLGDRVLGLCVSQMLYAEFPNAREGELSVRLNTLVSGKMCAEVADELELHRYIQAGSDIRNLAGKRMQSVRADVVESIIAAIYLDAGLDAAQQFVSRFWKQRLHRNDAGVQDSKGTLRWIKRITSRAAHRPAF